jgi:predicted S18 family serine protease
MDVYHGKGDVVTDSAFVRVSGILVRASAAFSSGCGVFHFPVWLMGWLIGFPYFLAHA